MPIPDGFPNDPYVTIDPALRFRPKGAVDHEHLVPPLVPRVRQGVKAWRAADYPGVSATTRALLLHWFETDHMIPTADGVRPFRWYFAQREAVESAIWLYEHENARNPYALIAYDASGRLARKDFASDWPHYLMKLATGSGKTKVLSLLMVWSYFHALYETDSPLSTNILLVAPNIIVLERLKADFDGERIFFDDPLLPPNGYENRDWQADFQVHVHVQDTIGRLAKRGNFFLTNIHRVSDAPPPASFDDEDTTDYFLGPKPVTKTTDSQADLGAILRDIDDLVIFNDEAHHARENTAWLSYIQDIVLKIRQREGRFGGQFDVSATPKHDDSRIFAYTISDYPLAEAIRQRVVKKPVVPNEASRENLSEGQSTDFIVKYKDHITLGVQEWRKYQTQLDHTGRNPVLFIMTDETRNCDRVADYLKMTYPEFADGVLVIHTKDNGQYFEGSSAKSIAELRALRDASRSIDEPGSPIKVVVSVMMLREGWDVQSVCVIVGLRAYNSKAKILPEQTLGRGLRRMFRGDDSITETLSVIGTPAFLDFVAQLNAEGVELDAVPMGEDAVPTPRIAIFVDVDNPSKSIPELDIEWPILSQRFDRAFDRLAQIDVAALPAGGQTLASAANGAPRKIVFHHIDTDEISHVTELGDHSPTAPEQVISWFAEMLRRDRQLVSGTDILFGKIKDYVETRLFNQVVSIDEPAVLRSLAQPGVTEMVFQAFRSSIHQATLIEHGAVVAERWKRLSQTPPYSKLATDYVQATKSVFNKVVGDNQFESDVAAFLEQAFDVTAYAKNDQHVGFKMDYVSPRGVIAHYYPDFLVMMDGGSDRTIYIVETKGQEDIDVAPKRQRLEQWCEDASRLPGLDLPQFSALYIDQARWSMHRPQLRTFHDLKAVFGRS